MIVTIVLVMIVMATWAVINGKKQLIFFKTPSCFRQRGFLSANVFLYCGQDVKA
jgi:hypothetical protein